MFNFGGLVEIEPIVNTIFGENLHKKRQESLSYAAIGLLASGSLLLHEMGTGMAFARGVNKKHATKQIDRLLSNKGYDIWEIASDWVPYVIGKQTHIYVALDWTSFFKDKQYTLCLNVLTTQGCSTPLLWKSVDTSRLKFNRARYEDQLLSRLKAVLPDGVTVTIVADRGFQDGKFLTFIEHELGFNYIIRMRANTFVTDGKGHAKKSQEWVRTDGRARAVKNVTVTKKHYPVAQFVCVKDKGMKDNWLLLTNIPELKTREIINLYARRWKIEPYFRDIKDGRYGYGLRNTHINSNERRDRLLLIVALCYMLLLLMGQAGEALGLDSLLKVNTVKTRTHSLFRQGQFYLHFFPVWEQEQQKRFLEQFGQLFENKDFWLMFLHEKL